MAAKSVKVGLALLVVFAVQAAYVCGPVASEKQTSDHLVSVVVCSVLCSFLWPSYVKQCPRPFSLFSKCSHKSTFYEHHSDQHETHALTPLTN